MTKHRQTQIYGYIGYKIGSEHRKYTCIYDQPIETVRKYNYLSTLLREKLLTTLNK